MRNTASIELNIEEWADFRQKSAILSLLILETIGPDV